MLGGDAVVRISGILLFGAAAAASALVAALADGGIVSDASVVITAFLTVVTVGLIGAAVFERWFYPAVHNPHLPRMRRVPRAQRMVKCAECGRPLTSTGSLLICDTCDRRPVGE